MLHAMNRGAFVRYCLHLSGNVRVGFAEVLVLVLHDQVLMWLVQPLKAGL